MSTTSPRKRERVRVPTIIADLNTLIDSFPSVPTSAITSAAPSARSFLSPDSIFGSDSVGPIPLPGSSRHLSLSINTSNSSPLSASLPSSPSPFLLPFSNSHPTPNPRVHIDAPRSASATSASTPLSRLRGVFAKPTSGDFDEDEVEDDETPMALSRARSQSRVGYSRDDFDAYPYGYASKSSLGKMMNMKYLRELGELPSTSTSSSPYSSSSSSPSASSSPSSFSASFCSSTSGSTSSSYTWYSNPSTPLPLKQFNARSQSPVRKLPFTPGTLEEGMSARMRPRGPRPEIARRERERERSASPSPGLRRLVRPLPVV